MLTHPSIVHGIIVIQEVLRTTGIVLNTYGTGGSNCSHCRQRTGKPKDGSTYSLLAAQDHQYEDIEGGLSRDGPTAEGI